MAHIARRTKAGRMSVGTKSEIEKVVSTEEGTTFSFADNVLTLTAAEIERIYVNHITVRNKPGKYANNERVLRRDR